MPVPLGPANDHGFDEPIGLLTDCHRRVESFLGVLRRVAEGGPALSDERARALRESLRYFREAAPRHTADEEESLFPRMRRAGSNALSEVERLEADHAHAAPMHAEVERLGGAWLAKGTMDPADQARLLSTVIDLETLYREHIRAEESMVFPEAARLLSARELAEVGSEMRARRGLKP
ncbi:MAG: hemerythrin domain-containing protein [Phycisphaerales bacterium]|nr:hemerythrin domain-containing protein [Phycisphaerales bacterium]